MGSTSNALRGRVALVTGAGRGIGRAIALGLAEGGSRVAVLARSVDQVEETVALVTDRGGVALAVPADLGSPEATTVALETVRGNWGTVEVLVNNAAVVWPLGPSAELDPGEWQAAIEINVVAAARLSFAVLPGMLEQGWGRIVNVSSGIAARPTNMLRANAYTTSKAALEAHTLNLAAELVGSGVTVNVFRPGSVDTAMQSWIRAQDPSRIGVELHERFIRNHEEQNLLTPQRSASSLLARLDGAATGETWSATDPS